MRVALTVLVAASTTAPGRKRQIQPPRRLIRCAPFVVCDHASPSAAVVLHLRPRYVSKAAFLGLPGHRAGQKIEVSFEFQGLGSLGAARGDGFSLASLTA
jgi:hypothetical protein